VPLWILDEPFSALDVGAVAELERLLAAHLAAGGMVVLTTHQEVQVVAHAVLRVDLDAHAAMLLAA
jgi:heme exporter protein A